MVADSRMMSDVSVTDHSDDSIRDGSPFAAEPPRTSRSIFPAADSQWDIGPVRYTAGGAVLAAIVVLAFGAIAAWWFPSGGALIATLGMSLALFGCLSPYRIVAGGLLFTHLALFMLCYSRMIA